MFKHLPLTGVKEAHPRRPAWGMLAALVGLLALALPTALQAASFTVTLDRDNITLGESATLTMSFEGGTPASLPTPPSIPNLQIVDGGANIIAMNVVNGVASQSMQHTFSVTSTRPGRYTIPSMPAKIGGQTYLSQPVTLIVSKIPPPPSGVNTENPDIAFLRLEIPKPTVYVGEVVRAELQIYLRDGVLNMQNVQLNPPQAEGFTIGQQMKGAQRQTRIGNFNYTIVPIITTYTAAKVGSLTLGSTECSMDLFFGPVNFFGQPTRRQHVTLTNEPVTIQSLPLPKDNVPPGFSGAIGNYTMNVSVSPTNVAVGDPITVKIQISGTGALEGVTLPPQMGWQQFRLYPPTADFQPGDQLAVSGTKNFVLTVVPESMDLRELPPFLFTFFDPDKKSYRTLSQPAVPLIVRPSAASLPPPTFSNAASSDNPAPVMDVSPIKPRLGSLAQVTPLLVRQPWFIVLQAIPALAWLSLLIRHKQKENLANNPRLRRQRQVDQTIRAGLKELRQSANANDPAAFFATAFRLLQEQLGERLDLPASAITEAVLEERLRPLKVPDAQLAALRELFQACNQARYAPQTTSAELVSLLPKFESALNDLKKVKA